MVQLIVNEDENDRLNYLGSIFFNTLGGFLRIEYNEESDNNILKYAWVDLYSRENLYINIRKTVNDGSDKVTKIISKPVSKSDTDYPWAVYETLTTEYFFNIEIRKN